MWGLAPATMNALSCVQNCGATKTWIPSNTGNRPASSSASV